MKRTDEHRPSAISPEDYEWISFDYYGSSDLGAIMMMRFERERFTAHMKETGGRFSGHEHGGTCHVCGCVNVTYASIFYHAKSNSYIVTGEDCARKLEMGVRGDWNKFRAAVHNALEAQAGKKKAQALLANANLSDCWTLYVADYASLPVDKTRPYYNDYADADNNAVAGYHPYAEEQKVREVVGSVVKYGSLSDKQIGFLTSLTQRITERPAKQALYVAEREAAANCPTGRTVVNGTVIKIEERDNPYGGRYGGSIYKMTVKDKSGYIVWTTVPSGLEIPKRGDAVEFTATLTPSDRDLKFGFGKRPVAGHPETPAEKKARKAAEAEKAVQDAELLEANPDYRNPYSANFGRDLRKSEVA